MDIGSIWRTAVGSYPPPTSERQPQVIREATFPACHDCGGRDYRPIESAEAFISGGWRFVKQKFQCIRCGHRRRLTRRLDRDWTGSVGLARAGIQR